MPSIDYLIVLQRPILAFFLCVSGGEGGRGGGSGPVPSNAVRPLVATFRCPDRCGIFPSFLQSVMFHCQP